MYCITGVAYGSPRIAESLASRQNGFINRLLYGFMLGLGALGVGV